MRTIAAVSTVVLLAFGLARADTRPHPPRRHKTDAPAPASSEATPAPTEPSKAAAEAPPADTASAGTPAAPAPAAPQANDLNFDLFGDSKTLTPQQKAEEARRQRDIERRGKIRRFMLVSHQALGFAMMGSMAATLVTGQLVYLDKYGGGNDNTGVGVGMNGPRSALYTTHFALSISSGVLFTATGLSALFAPNPYPKPIKLDAALVHKVSMAIATAGMIAQGILGPIAASREGKLDQRDYALAHLVVGYASYAFIVTGVLAYVF